MPRKLIFLIGSVVFTLYAHAQSTEHSPFSNQMLDFAWDVNIPASNKLITDVSWAGFKMEYRKMVAKDLSVGIEVGWNAYHQYIPRRTYTAQNGAITTDFYPYIYNLPLAANVHHYFHAGKLVFPYIGLALGATYSEQKLYYNTYYSSDYNWGFLVRPELGAIFKFNEFSNTSFLFGVRYSYSTNQQDNFEINGLQSLGFQLGVVFMK